MDMIIIVFGLQVMLKGLLIKGTLKVGFISKLAGLGEKR